MMNFFKDVLDSGRSVYFAHTADEDLIYFNLNPLFKAWKKVILKRDRALVTKKMAMDFLRKQSGLRNLGMSKNIKGKNHRCVVFDIREAPAELKKLVSYKEDPLA